ncbi:hypothetical protein CBOM_04411 [Ceraceosorus bombacis]|uniref:Uncharacterized protein n=1 Tax=Ceraceosorus bombacis TaxID=401625 RepID=A0A0P1BQ83_9BASI|nr:hypothetical protein CBOM_04411 [Ceraceosorus bombacis]
MADSSPERLVALIVDISKTAAPVAYLGCVCCEWGSIWASSRCRKAAGSRLDRADELAHPHASSRASRRNAVGLVIGDFFGALEWDLALVRECKTRVMAAYFMARTCSVIALSVLIALMSAGSFKIDICRPLAHVLSTFIALSTASAQYLYVGRVTSIWPARPWVRFLMLLTWSLSALSWIPLIVLFVSVQNPVGLLVCIPAEPVSDLVSIPYFFNMAYDLLVFALIIVGFYRQGKLNVFKRGSTNSDLTHRLVVTTILYLTILSLFFIGQTIAFWVAEAPVRRVLSAPLHTALDHHLVLAVQKLATASA